MCAGNSELGGVDIKHFISFSVCFNIDSIKSDLRKAKAAYEFSRSKQKTNHLLFMNDLKLYSRIEKELDSLVQTSHIFSKDIEMEFRIEECAMLVVEKGKIVKSIGIELLDGKVVKSLQEGESYRYLGILEADRFLREEIKLAVSKEYFRRLKKFFEITIENWEFSSKSRYLSSIPFKIFSSIY